MLSLLANLPTTLLDSLLAVAFSSVIGGSHEPRALFGRQLGIQSQGVWRRRWWRRFAVAPKAGTSVLLGSSTCTNHQLRNLYTSLSLINELWPAESPPRALESRSRVVDHRTARVWSCRTGSADASQVAGRRTQCRQSVVVWPSKLCMATVHDDRAVTVTSTRN